MINRKNSFFAHDTKGWGIKPLIKGIQKLLLKYDSVEQVNDLSAVICISCKT